MTDDTIEDALVGKVVLDRYRLVRRIGSGGMGSVYEAVQLAVGRSVAIKVLRPDLMTTGAIRDRFRREAEIIGRLRHPHTINLIDYGETEDGLALMVTELLLGSPLDEVIAERGPLPIEQVLSVGEHVAGSLYEAHGYDLVHRDLKPANIFVTSVSGQPFCKVLDFGIARMMDDEATRLTAAGQVFGTPRYMSPEQASSSGDVDARADLYSLGLVLFECASGRSPFKAKTAIQYLAAQVTEMPPALRELCPEAPPELEALIHRLLQKDPADRPLDAEQVRRQLMAIGASLGQSLPSSGVVTVEPSLPSPTRPEASRFPAPRTEEPPAGRHPAAYRWGWSVAPVVLGLGLVWASVNRSSDETTGSGPDAATVARLGPPEGAAATASERPDAAIAEDASVAAQGSNEPDAAAEGQRDAGKAESRRRRRPRSGVVSKPRGMRLETEAKIDRRELADKCWTSQWLGMGRLTVEDCPSGCSILVDDLCAGRTPAEDRPIAPGNRRVAVFCDGQRRVGRKARFREGKTTTILCR